MSYVLDMYDLMMLTFFLYSITLFNKVMNKEFLDNRINLRVKPSDRKILQEKADEKKVSLSAYCRTELIKTIIK